MNNEGQFESANYEQLKTILDLLDDLTGIALERTYTWAVEGEPVKQYGRIFTVESWIRQLKVLAVSRRARAVHRLARFRQPEP